MIPLRCALLAGALVVATASACGGSGAPQAGERSLESSAAPPVSPVSVGSSSPASTDASPAATTPPGSTLPGSTLPATTAAGSTVAATPAAAAVLPAVEVTDVATGAKYSLASLVATDRPTLFWMWAPH